MRLPVLHLNQMLCVSGASKVMENLAALTDEARFEPMLAGIHADEAHVAHLRERGFKAAALGLDMAGLRELIDPGVSFAVVVHRSGHQQPEWDRVLPALKRSGAAAIMERSIFGYPDKGQGGFAVDVHVCNSMNTLRRDWLARGRPDLDRYLETHRVIYNPVVVGDPKACHKQGRLLRKKLGIPSDAFVLSTVTRPDPNKLDYILAAVFPRLRQTLGDVYLIARSLPDAIAKSLEKTCGRHFINLPTASKTQDVTATLAASDVMVHMSTIGESFGMAIAEAMSLGKPVITNETRQDSKSNAQGELIKHGESGYLFNDSYSVYRQLVTLAEKSGERERVGANAQARFVEGTLCPAHVIRQWQRTLVDACGEHAQGLSVPGEPSSQVSTGLFQEYLNDCDGPAQSQPYSVPLLDKPWAVQADLRRLCFRGKRRFAA